MKKFNWEKAWNDACKHFNKNSFNSFGLEEDCSEMFSKWLTEEIIIDNTDELPQAWEEEGFRSIKKVQRINLYLEED